MDGWMDLDDSFGGLGSANRINGMVWEGGSGMVFISFTDEKNSELFTCNFNRV